MKYLLTLLTFGLLLACGAPKEITTDADVIAEEVVQDPLLQLAQKFATAVIRNDADYIRPYYLDLTSARLILGAKAISYTNEQLQDIYLKPLLARFEQNLMKLQNGLEAKNRDRSKLAFKKYQLEDAGPNSFSKPMIVVLDDGGEEIRIPISYIELHEKLYVHEILMTTGIF